MSEEQLLKKPKMLEHLEAIAPSMPFPVYWADLNSKVLGANEACLKAMGAATPSEVIGKTPYDYYPLEIADSIFHHVNAVIKAGITLSQEDRIVDITTGDTRYFTATRGPIFDDAGTAIGIMGTSIEITAEKETERLKLEGERKEAESLRRENEIYKQMLQQQEKFSKLAFQVAHDIASPTAALSMLVNACDDIPEEARLLLKETATRINDIAHNLLNQYKTKNNNAIITNENPETILLSTTILHLLTEKRLQYANTLINFNYNFDQPSYFTFIKAQSSALKRSLSNLINNAVEACEHKTAEIKITLNSTNEYTKITIEDNGKGMPQEIINKILKSNAISTDKKEGHGIGLSQVFETLKQNQGQLHIESRLGQGTKITLTFPNIDPPLWLCKEITLDKHDIIVILDDDKAIHRAWDARLELIAKTNPTIQIKHFELANDAITFCQTIPENQKSKLLLLTDFELLKQNQNGLDVIEQTQLKRAILVTSHYTKPDIQDQATKLNTKILPKQLASEIQLKIKQEP